MTKTFLDSLVTRHPPGKEPGNDDMVENFSRLRALKGICDGCDES